MQSTKPKLFFLFFSDSNHLMLPNGDLVILNLDEDDIYSCSVKNLLNGEISSSKGLKVQVQGRCSLRPKKKNTSRVEKRREIKSFGVRGDDDEHYDG